MPRLLQAAAAVLAVLPTAGTAAPPTAHHIRQPLLRLGQPPRPAVPFAGAQKRGKRADPTKPAATEADLLAWEDRLRGKVNAVSSDATAVRARVRQLQDNVVRLMGETGKLSKSLGLALAKVQDGADARERVLSKLGALQGAKNASDLNITSLEAQVKNLTDLVTQVKPVATKLVKSVGQQEDQLNALLPGGATAKLVDQLASDMAAYDKEIRVVVNRVFAANNSAAYKDYLAQNMLALSNLSNITQGRRVTCDCPPCGNNFQ